MKTLSILILFVISGVNIPPAAAGPLSRIVAKLRRPAANCASCVPAVAAVQGASRCYTNAQGVRVCPLKK